jgi:hypothetical protein
VSVGENGTAANAQDLSIPLGKILRFNEDGSIPTDNPFYGSQTGLARAIWALRPAQPVHLRACKPGTGRIHINDVGQSTWEEINLGVAGRRTTAGRGRKVPITSRPASPVRSSPTTTPPVVPAGFGPGRVHRRLGGPSAARSYPATGNFPAAYRNSYFFADYPAKWVRRLDTVNQGERLTASPTTSTASRWT